MDEVTIHLANSHPIDIHCQGQPDRPCSGFLLIACIPCDPPGCVMLNYGNSDVTGVMLMTLYQRSVHEHPELAWVMEQVSRTIVGFADKERAKWPQSGPSGMA